MQIESSARVSEIIRTTLTRLDSSKPLGISQIFCDLLNYFTTDLTPLSSTEQLLLSNHLLDQGILDIVLDLLSSLTIDLATYINLLTLIVTLLTIANNTNKYTVGRLSRIVDYVLTAAHNALNVLLSDRIQKHYDLYYIISSCLSLLQELAVSFPNVRILILTSHSFMHLIVRDDGVVTEPILSCLCPLLKMCGEELQSIRPRIIYNILDELILKLTQSDQLVVKECLESIRVILSNCTQLQPARLSRRYKGIAHILKKKMLGSDFDDLIREVMQMLEPHFKFEDEKHWAAQRIQSVWRGHLERKRLTDLREAAILIQRRFRNRKWVLDFNRRCEKAKLLKQLRRQDEMREQSIRSQTEFFKTLEKLPARKVRLFLEKRRYRSAVLIQQWWRRLKRKEKLNQLRKGRVVAAIIIQKCFREFLAKQRGTELNHRFEKVTPDMIQKLEKDFNLFRQTRVSRKIYSNQELRKIESKVSGIIFDDSLDYPSRQRLLRSYNELLEIVENKCITLRTNTHL